MDDQPEARLAPVTLLLALLAQGTVCISRDDLGFCVLAGHVAGQAQTLGGALGKAYDEATANDPINLRDARRQARVQLPEGGLGTLTRIATHSRTATVHTDEGRWRHLPLSSLHLYHPERMEHT